ncbi:unnamed protein product [Miscanthus lutarioriparius]|uniref:Uncharacterized protein n=1 Tax=Miscanthus lutarioriparius TaxID=422564 RepID=A0A811SBU1_9POAL|nr:unnamed protein product [Miscanthus lutarioriparius]
MAEDMVAGPRPCQWARVRGRARAWRLPEEGFMAAADNALPYPMQDAYLEAYQLSHNQNGACRTFLDFVKFSNLNVPIEFVLEYHVNFGNPDIDEKPPMSLEEMLQKEVVKDESLEHPI